MDGINLIQRLESRAALAEKLISLLKAEIAEVSSMISAVQDSKRIEFLKSEIQSLEEKVLKSKEELIQIQKRNGIEQVPLPKDDKIGPAATEIKIVKTREKKSIKSSEDSDEKDKEKKEIDFGRLDLRVGRILESNYHPDAKNLYILQIDTGEPVPRQIISGLRKQVSAEDLLLRPVVCICNLKAKVIRGEKSNGMVMCALYNSTVEPLWPPINAIPGEILVAGSYVLHPDKELNPKKKVFETVVKDFRVNENKVLMYKDIPVKIKNRGPVTTKMLFNCSVG